MTCECKKQYWNVSDYMTIVAIFFLMWKPLLLISFLVLWFIGWVLWDNFLRPEKKEAIILVPETKTPKPKTQRLVK